ncbi:Rne/Rng family ribonuclease [Brevibacillus sp. TJ4]|uniref:Rne/Rng family ribonuclease n=1 Tax=Brevibacillus sp. TJ4 TaxID=3234853 RepID=UPI003BA3A491
MRQIAIGGSGEDLWIGLLERGHLLEWRSGQEETEARAGEIYQARVTDVLPAIQSAFLDLGQGQNAYMYVDDAPLPAHASQEKQSIRERVHEGQKLLVQIDKEATDHKAPKVTAQISIQGRYLVYLPHGGGLSLSRKIRDAAIRARMQEELASLMSAEEGLIVRTEAAEASVERVADELSYLRQCWQQIAQTASASGRLGRISREAEWIERSLLDFLAHDVEEVLVEDAAIYQQLKAVIARLEPGQLELLRRYQGRESLRAWLGVDVQLHQALQRQVPLPGGGSIVIDRTEAMTVIDVNTGAFTGKGGQQREQAVAATNLEAATVIAAQLRLRDIGGIILIDFIDMKQAENKERLLTMFKRELARDPVPSTVLGMTALGLVEMTRKRVRPSLAERISRPCEMCRGSGRIRSVEYLVRMLCDELEGMARTQDAEAAVVELPTHMHRQFSGGLGSTPGPFPIALHAVHNPSLSAEEYRIVYAGRREEAERLSAIRQSQKS